MDCSYREKRERRKRGGKEREEGLFFSLFLPFLDDRLLIFFFSRAFLFCARLKVKSDEDDEDEEE